MRGFLRDIAIPPASAKKSLGIWSDLHLLPEGRPWRSKWGWFGSAGLLVLFCWCAVKTLGDVEPAVESVLSKQWMRDHPCGRQTTCCSGGWWWWWSSLSGTLSFMALLWKLEKSAISPRRLAPHGLGSRVLPEFSPLRQVSWSRIQSTCSSMVALILQRLRPGKDPSQGRS